MSQYPSPYYPHNPQPPYLPYGGAVDVLAPAKRASILMFILGPLLMACGGCMISMTFMLSMVPQDKLQPLLDKLQNTGVSLQMLFGVFGSLMLVPGISLLVLAFFVRRGGVVSTILSIVLVGVILLASVVEFFGTLLQAGDPNAIPAVCMNVLELGLFGLLLYWLILAARASSSVQRAQQQYLAQYWQYQQNMQAYSGYGYAAPPQEGQSYHPPVVAPAMPPQLPPAENGSTPPPPNGG